MEPDSDDDIPIHSRYADYDGVSIDEEFVPDTFRHLLNDALEWSIADDVERDAYMSRMSVAQLQSFVDAVWPYMAPIDQWCRTHQHDFPNEVIVFSHLTEAAAEARITLDRLSSERDA